MRKITVKQLFENKNLTENQKKVKNTILFKFPKYYNSEKLLTFIISERLVEKHPMIFLNKKTTIVRLDKFMYDYCKIKKIPFILDNEQLNQNLYNKVRYTNLKSKL